MKNSKTKKMVINALMIGIGAVLHQITPVLGLPMQPDFALAMLFIIIILNYGDYKTSLTCGIILGIGTLVSGVTFIYFASLIVGLPAPFIALFNTVVIPTALINLVAGVILFKIVQTSIKRALV